MVLLPQMLRQARTQRDEVRVMAPLGMRVGQGIDWELPSGEKHHYKVVAVPFQADSHADEPPDPHSAAPKSGGKA